MREGEIKLSERKRGILKITTKSSIFIIIGCSKKTSDLIEGYASTGVPAPIEIEGIEKLEWLENLDLENTNRTLIFDRCISLMERQND